jgi:hypothetical protein
MIHAIVDRVQRKFPRFSETVMFIYAVDLMQLFIYAVDLMQPFGVYVLNSFCKAGVYVVDGVLILGCVFGVFWGLPGPGFYIAHTRWTSPRWVIRVVR